MKLTKQHIVLYSFIIVGLFSMIFKGVDYSSVPEFVTEYELEESFSDDIDELTNEKESFDSDSNGGDKAVFIVENINLIYRFSDSILLRLVSKSLSKKPHFFILYCCLKIDC